MCLRSRADLGSCIARGEIHTVRDCKSTVSTLVCALEAKRPELLFTPCLFACSVEEGEEYEDEDLIYVYVQNCMYSEASIISQGKGCEKRGGFRVFDNKKPSAVGQRNKTPNK